MREDVTRIIEISMGQKGSKYITFDSIGNEDLCYILRLAYRNIGIFRDSI